ncbi:MAG: glucose-1-phosphate cytidylyltransferase [Verrucomicrobia subdivision 3 bacterium]|nr:glucose-1-phosphate cytidylyltransferase [Limisphaerales bacterium]
MKVVILCGGMGTRLREETEYRPKPMVPIGGRPILWHIMKLYAHFGHKEFILCLGYKGEVIKEYFRNYHWNTSDVTLRLGRSPDITYHGQHDEEDWLVTLIDTGQETQTGGRLLRVLPYIKDEAFFFTYGDGLTDSDINRTVQFHRKHGALATVTAVKPTGRFGELAMDGQTITAFHEKPDQEGAFISGGFFVFNRDIEKYLDGDECVLEKAPMERLTRERQLRAWRHKGFWQCMDTYREQELLNQLWRSGKAPWKLW